MRTVFADTVGLLALWDQRDQWHSAAARAYERLASSRTRFLTTTYVLLECSNAAARRPYRRTVDRLRLQLENAGLLVTPTDEDWREAWRAYSSEPSDGAGVVDHVSFRVMRRFGLSHAFTNDRHFRAARFETLF